MHTQRRHALRLIVASALVASGVSAAAQEDWKPAKPIRLVVPFPPGGGADVLGRLTSQGVGARLGQSVVVENKGGASGSIGSDYVYKSPADGTVALIATPDSLSMFPHIAKVGFDSQKFVPLSGIAEAPYVLMGRADLPATTLPELLALMKTRTLSYSSAGQGTTPHILGALFAKEARSELLHVPFQGTGPATQALLSGTVDLGWVSVQAAVQFRSKLRAFGTPSRQRLAAFGDIPTLSEQGLAVVGASWLAWVAPPGTPEPIVAAMSKAVRETVASAEVTARLHDMGMVPMQLSQPEFAKFYQDEYRRWGEVIRAANIRAE